MILPDAFLTETLKSLPQGRAVTRILAAAVKAVAPDEAVRRFLRRDADQLFLRTSAMDDSAGLSYDLGQFRRVRIFGLGKAAVPMSLAVTSLLAGKTWQGLLVVKHPAESLPAGFEQVVGGHPVPDKGSLLAGERLRAFLAGGQPDDLLICLISGGGSALLTSPHAPITLADMQALTTLLLASGARIDEINTLRRHLDSLKGGGLANLAAPAQVISLILSDVVGSPLEAIASGPTAPDPSSRAEALQILEKYELKERVAPAILQVLLAAPETPKVGSSLFARVQNVIVGDNYLAAQAALQQARLEGLTPFYLRGDLQGEARLAALELCGVLRSVLLAGQPVAAPFCLVAGGETTVTLRGKGQGGRNQELALAAVADMAGLPGSLLVSLATDGEDGPTKAAGAVVSPQTSRRGLQAGLDVQTYLAENDSYNYFAALGDLLKPGPTGTNVNDLTFLFGFNK